MPKGTKIGLAAAFALASLAGQPAAAQEAQSPRPPACATPEHRQFDFWVGEWDVYRTSGGPQVARSRIERLYEGCAIRENWMPLQGGPGGSLNSWLPDRGKWVQTWADSSNSYAVFEGGMDGQSMVLTGVWKGAKGPGSAPLVRMTYTPLEGGAVRQFGETSDDEGQTWEPYFDLTYRPRGTTE